jgi:FkbM family methyltransferase
MTDFQSSLGLLKWRLKKYPRTAQSYLPALKEGKDAFYRWYRRISSKPSDGDFAAIALFRDVLHGTYVDIGANTGQSIESIKLFAPAAKIVSFEPNPELAVKLERRYRRDSSVSIKAIGLSDSVSALLLHVPVYLGFVYDGLASLNYADAKSWINNDTVFFFSPKRLSVRSHRCQVETLDMQGIDNPIFIKIDVEGFETNVIKGGVETLRRHEPILLVESLHDKPELQQLVATLGFRPYHYASGKFVPGFPAHGQTRNTFLITDGRFTQIERQHLSA